MQTAAPILQAHATGLRYELPIPLWLFVVGGAAVVVLSFVIVLRKGAPDGVPELEAADVVPLHRFSAVPALASIVVMLGLAVLGLIGTQEVALNITPQLFWLVVWVVVPMTCGLIGDWTRAVNPFANLARIGNDPSLRKTVLARKQPLVWSKALGWWPAVGMFLLLVLAELVFNADTTKPAFVGGMLLAYSVLTFFLGLLFGDAWLERGEVFSALFNAWGRLGYWRFGAPGRKGFTGGLDVPVERSASRTVFLLLLLVSINFDGLTATRPWVNYKLSHFGASVNDGYVFSVVALLVLVVIVLAVFLGFAIASARLGGHPEQRIGALSGLVPSLVPIAYGYLIAHNLQYVLVNIQDLWPLLTNNPGFGDGSTSSFSINTNVLPPSVNWYVAVVAIVLVHVVAVVLAHRYLARRGADEKKALRSEFPWLVAMVAYTVFSLVLIAEPITQDGGGPVTKVQSSTLGPAR